MTEKAKKYVLRLEFIWIGLLGNGRTIEAKIWSPALDALIDDDPQKAIRLIERMESPKCRNEIPRIREAFDLTDA